MLVSKFSLPVPTERRQFGSDFSGRRISVMPQGNKSTRLIFMIPVLFLSEMIRFMKDLAVCPHGIKRSSCPDGGSSCSVGVTDSEGGTDARLSRAPRVKRLCLPPQKSKKISRVIL